MAIDISDCFAHWLARTLRFTAFHSSQDDISPSEWWAEIVGESPDTETAKPKQAIRTAQGSYKGGMLALTKSPLVVDLRLQPPTDIQVTGLPALGAFQDLYPDFVDIAKKLFDIGSFPAISRFAFGAELALEVTDIKEGCVYLDSCLPAVHIDTNNSRDFFYQINRRRPSSLSIPALSINRLNNWSLQLIQSGQINLLTPHAQSSDIETYWSCRLELDINTCQGFSGELPQENYSDILDELVAMGVEIATKGDVK